VDRPAFPAGSLEKINIPVAIVAGAADTNVPIASSAQFFAKHIPQGQLTLLPGVPHYSFLATCSKTAQPLLCADPEGIDRDVVHAEAVRLAVNFFAAKLK
jgi:predicted dienelactone hydrolase